MRTVNKEKEVNHRHFVAVRLTDVELNLLDQGAACFSISRSEYLRKLLLEKQINHQIEVVADMNDLIKRKRLNFRYDRKTPRLLSSSRSTLTIHI